MVSLNRYGSVWNRAERIKQNDDKQIVEDFINGKINDTLAEEAFSTWMIENEFKPKGAVATFADLPADPELKEIRLVEGENTQYLYDGSEWVVFGIVNADGLTTLTEDVAKRSIMQSDVQTFQIPTDYPTLQEAINELSGRTFKHGSVINLNIETGHTLSDTLSLSNGDYSHFRITSADAEVFLADTFPKATYAKFTNCSAPTLATVIDGGGYCANGILLDGGSVMTVESTGGFRRAGTTNLYVRGGATAYVEPLADFTYGSQDGDSASGGSGITAWGGQVFAESVDVSFSNTYGAQAAHGGTLSFRDGKANNCGRHGIRGTNSATVDARGAQANDCGAHAVYALSGSIVNAYGVSGLNAGSIGLFASQSSTINAREAIVDGSGTGVLSERGSKVDFYSGSAVGCINAGIISQSASIINAFGATVNDTVASVTGHGVRCLEGSVINLGGASVKNSGGNDLYINKGGTITAIRCNTTNSATNTPNKPYEGDTNATTFNQPTAYFGIIWAAAS